MKKYVLLSFSLWMVLIPISLWAVELSPEEEALIEESEEASSEETSESEEDSSGPVKGIAQGAKQVAYDGPKELVEETAEEATKKPPIVSVVEGVNKGTQKLLDNTVKGAYKVATLGTSELESYEVQEPEKGSGEPTKIKISIPGT